MSCKNYFSYNNLRILISLESCINIKYSKFINLLINNEKGGAIYIEDVTKNIFIEITIFHDCKSINSEGGAFFLIVLNCNLIKICGSYCSANALQFGKSSINNNLIFNDSSIYKCPKEYQICSHTIMIDSGNQLCRLINSSYNELSGHSASIHFNFPFSLNSNFLTLSYCYGQHIVTLNGGNGYNFINNSNIVNNNPTSTLFYCYKTYYILNSNIFSNSNNNVNSGNLIFNNCKTIFTLTYNFQSFYNNICNLNYKTLNFKKKKLFKFFSIIYLII